MMRFKPLAAVVSLICLSVPAAAFAEQDTLARPPDLTVLRGRVSCLETLKGCSNGADFSFEASDGGRFEFLATDPATAIFTDPRVRQRELQLVARLHKGRELEVIRVRSYREGKLHDIYYFCEVCNITTYAPGPCPCCRDELELRETPVSGSKSQT